MPALTLMPAPHMQTMFCARPAVQSHAVAGQSVGAKRLGRPPLRLGGLRT
jgi:hypothetical protein